MVAKTKIGAAVQNVLKTDDKDQARLQAIAAAAAQATAQVPAITQISETTIPVDAKRQAAKWADEAYDIQWRKGGIEDVKKELEGLQGKVGEKVYNIAKLACQLTGSLKIAHAMFLALCAFAEKHLKAYHVEKTKEEISMGKLIPQWSAYKADIAKGLANGVDPSTRNEAGSLEYSTAAQYREKARKVTGTDGNGANTDGQSKEGRANAKGSVVTLLADRGWEPTLAAAMNVMCEKLNALGKDQQATFAPRILAIAAEADDLRLKSQDVEHAEGRDPVSEIVREMGEKLGHPLDEGTLELMQAALDRDNGPKGKSEAQEIARAAAGSGKAGKGGIRVA